MIEPVAVENFSMAFFSSAMVLLTGALYAFLFALSRLYRNPRLTLLAYSAYAPLVGSVLVLSKTMHLNGPWLAVVVIMLVGYLFAPQGIWYLCVGTYSAMNTNTGERHHDE